MRKFRVLSSDVSLGYDVAASGIFAILRFSMGDSFSWGQCAQFAKSDCFESLSPFKKAA